jgi:uncharacterized protein
MNARPEFRYHPDPVGTGSAVRSDDPCELCKQPAGFIYRGPIFGEQTSVLCLRCIADGSAARRLAHPDGPAEFTDIGWGVPDEVPSDVLQELSQRTPGFFGWQQEHWLYHCANAAAFIGRIGWEDIKHLPDAQSSLLAQLVELGVDPIEAQRQLLMLHPNGDLTGYLFRCLHCGTHLAYSDAS